MMPPILASKTAADFNTYWQRQLQPLWHQFVHGELQGSEQTRLSYSYYLNSKTEQAVVISSGRVEMAVKYIELMQQFIAAGYSVFIMDHRGQGQSARLHHDLHMGYVADFQHYVEDFQLFVSKVVQPFGHRQHLLLAHSMGAAIACRYLQQYPHPFDAAIFSSPMFGLHAGRVPSVFASKLLAGYGWLRQRFNANNQQYFWGQSAYQAKPFIGNLLTHCEVRYQWLRQLYELYPAVQLGGVSWAWLLQALPAIASIQRHATEFNVPVLLLQAADDQIVSNNAQNHWFKRLPKLLHKQQTDITGAHHEIWMEKDAIRQQAIAAINQFLSELHSTPQDDYTPPAKSC